MKRGLTCLLITLFISGLSLAADKKRVAVLDFEFGTVQQWWGGTWDIGKGISDLVVTELVENGTYRVIERRRLDTVLSEQDFSTSDRANATTAAKVGKVLGVNAMIVGSITQFGTEKKKKSFGGGFGRLGGFGGGKFGTNKGKANVAIDARIIDINTGEILGVAKGRGESSRSGMLLGGFGGGGGGFGAGGIDMGSSDFRETILGEAVEAAVKDLSQNLITQEDRIILTAVELEGLIADVDGTTVILNIGSDAGVSVGALLKVARVTRTVKDPSTGEVIRRVTQEVGQVRVDEVDARSSVGTVTAGAAIRVGDMVKN